MLFVERRTPSINVYSRVSFFLLRAEYIIISNLIQQ